MARLRIVCSGCGSEKIKRHALAAWNFDAQAWELAAMTEAGVCEECECESPLKTTEDSEESSALGLTTSPAAFVSEAESWARALVRNECRFPGDYGPAMRRIATRSQVSFGLLWNLHYRKPKTISVECYAALAKAYKGLRRRQTSSTSPFRDTLTT